MYGLRRPIGLVVVWAVLLVQDASRAATSPLTRAEGVAGVTDAQLSGIAQAQLDEATAVVEEVSRDRERLCEERDSLKALLAQTEQERDTLKADNEKWRSQAAQQTDAVSVSRGGVGDDLRAALLNAIERNRAVVKKARELLAKDGRR